MCVYDWLRYRCRRRLGRRWLAVAVMIVVAVVHTSYTFHSSTRCSNFRLQLLLLLFVFLIWCCCAWFVLCTFEAFGLWIKCAHLSATCLLYCLPYMEDFKVLASEQFPNTIAMSYSMYDVPWSLFCPRCRWIICDSINTIEMQKKREKKRTIKTLLSHFLNHIDHIDEMKWRLLHRNERRKAAKKLFQLCSFLFQFCGFTQSELRFQLNAAIKRICAMVLKGKPFFMLVVVVVVIVGVGVPWERG